VDRPSLQTSSRRDSAALTGAWAALVVGLVYAGVSLYWALGGEWLLATVGRSLADGTHPVGGAATVAVWVAVALKALAAVLPILAISTPAPWRRWIRAAAWAEAFILTLYGFVETTVGLLVQAGIVHPGANADHRALFWHAYLWDPWFLAWGLLVLVALGCSRDRRQFTVRVPTARAAPSRIA
jgi:hypothetical protein